MALSGQYGEIIPKAHITYNADIVRQSENLPVCSGEKLFPVVTQIPPSSGLKNTNYFKSRLRGRIVTVWLL